MTKKQAIKLFEEKKVRTVWDDEKEQWYFSIIDVCAVLTDSPNPRNYWKVLKHRLVKEGNETVTNCNQLKEMQDYRLHLECTAECTAEPTLLCSSAHQSAHGNRPYCALINVSVQTVDILNKLPKLKFD